MAYNQMNAPAYKVPPAYKGVPAYKGPPTENCDMAVGCFLAWRRNTHT